MSAIKLLNIGENDGVTRLQSQLFLGRITADFIKDSDGVLKFWTVGVNGVGFYPYEGEYQIVSSSEEMVIQKLN